MDKDKTLENFMNEFFPFDEFKWFFKNIKKDNYKAQAKKVCKFFGYKTVYEYGSKEVRCHISYGEPGDFRPLSVDEKGELKEEPFITIIPSIYE